MNTFHLGTTKELYYHKKIIHGIFSFFNNTPGVAGCFVSGSTAKGTMDIDSDLDLGILIEDKERRESIWDNRWDWNIAPWFHRFDADHIKSYFVIYLFEPHIKADINLYIKEDLPGMKGAPYKIIWDTHGILGKWQDELKSTTREPVDWSNVTHEDERFWAWLFYLYSHIHRGEYYNGAMEFPAIRDIFEQWTAKLHNYNSFDSRRLECKPFAKELIHEDFFPKPDIKSLKKALLRSIKYFLKLREQIEDRQKIKWKTSKKAVKKISELIRKL